MGKTGLDDLIDCALDTRDFEWFKHLTDAKYNLENKAMAVDDIHNEYAILENGFLRNIRSLKDEEIIHNVVVKTNKFRPRYGDIVEYQLLDIYERYRLQGRFACKAELSSYRIWY